MGLLSSMLESAPDPIVVTDRAGRIALWNAQAEATFGWGHEDFAAISLADLVPAFDRPRLVASHETLAAGEAPLHQNLTLETYGLRRDGSVFPMELRSTILLEPMEGFIATGLQDISERRRQEDALRTSEQRLRQILENSTILYFAHAPDHRLTYVSPQSRTMLDCEPEEALVRWPELLTDHPVNQRGLDATERALRTGERQAPYELEIQTFRGRRLWVEVNEAPVVEEGRVVAMVGSLTDITARKRAQEALARASHEHQEILENIPDIIYRLDTQGRLVWWNRRMEAVTGYTPRELLLREGTDLFLPEEQPKIAEAVRTGLLSGFVQVEGNLLLKDGTTVPYQWTGGHLRNETGAVIGLTGVGRDITELKRVEKDLRRSEAQLAEAQRLAHIGSWEWDIPTGTVRSSAELDQIYGRPIGSGPGTVEAILSVIHPEDAPRMVATIKATKEEPRPFALDYRILRDGGDVRFVAARGEVVRDEDGTPIRVVGTIQDVSEQRKAEERFRALLESAPDAMIIADTGGRIVLANRQAESVFGWTRDELVGKPIEHLIPTRYRERHTHHRAVYSEDPRARPMGASLELWALRKDGTEFQVEISLSPLETEEGPVVTAAIRDVSDRRRAEDALREAEERFRSAFELAPIGMALVSPGGRFLKANPALCKILGYQEGDLTKMAVQEITHPDDLDADLESLQRALSGEIGHYDMEKRYFHQEGHIVWVLLSVSLVRNAAGEPQYVIAQIQDITARRETETRLRLSEARLGEAQELAKVGSWSWNVDTGRTEWSPEVERLYGFQPGDPAITPDAFNLRVHPEDREMLGRRLREGLLSGGTVSFDFRLLLPDNSTRWLHIRGEASHDDDGAPVRVHGTVQDVTDRRLAEDRLRASLREKEALLREIHHRVKNNLQVISSLLSIQSGYVEEPAARDLLTESRNRVRSMAMVHERLYQSRDLSRIDLADYLRGLTQEVIQSHGRHAANVRVAFELEEEYVGIDTAISCGLIMNELISNCLKHAFPDTRPGTVTISAVRLPEGRLCLEVADDGVGLPGEFDLRGAPSMGLQLVTALVDQLSGELHLNRADGTAIGFSFNIEGEGES